MPLIDLYVVLQQTPEGFVQAFSRNKTYLTIDGALRHGISHSAKITQQNEHGVIASDFGLTYLIVNVGDNLTERATKLVAH